MLHQIKMNIKPLVREAFGKGTQIVGNLQLFNLTASLQLSIVIKLKFPFLPQK